jgi:hypothetical protein
VNQVEHTLLMVDPRSKREIGRAVVGVNGHEVAVSQDGRLAYVPIYSNCNPDSTGRRFRLRHLPAGRENRSPQSAVMANRGADCSDEGRRRNGMEPRQCSNSSVNDTGWELTPL